jgi:hypothetical protein
MTLGYLHVVNMQSLWQAPMSPAEDHALFETRADEGR